MNTLIIRIMGTDTCPIERMNDYKDSNLEENMVYRSQYAILLASGDVSKFKQAYECSIHNIWLLDHIVRDVLANSPIEGYVESIRKTFHKELDDYTTFSILKIEKHEDGITFIVEDKSVEDGKWEITLIDSRIDYL